jgi:hypothetical protein
MPRNEIDWRGGKNWMDFSKAGIAAGQGALEDTSLAAVIARIQADKKFGRNLAMALGRWPQFANLLKPLQGPIDVVRAQETRCRGRLRVRAFLYSDCCCSDQPEYWRRNNSGVIEGIDTISLQVTGGNKYFHSQKLEKGEARFDDLEEGLGYQLDLTLKPPDRYYFATYRISTSWAPNSTIQKLQKAKQVAPIVLSSNEIRKGEETNVEIGLCPQPAQVTVYTYFDPQCTQDPKGKSPISAVPVSLEQDGKEFACQETGVDGCTTFDVCRPGLVAIKALEKLTAQTGCKCRLATTSPVMMQVNPGQQCCDVGFAYCATSAGIQARACRSLDKEFTIGKPNREPIPCTFLLYSGAIGESTPQVLTSNNDEIAFNELREGYYTVVALPPVQPEPGKLYDPPHVSVTVKACAGQMIRLSDQFCFQLKDAGPDKPTIEIEATDAEDGTALSYANVEIRNADWTKTVVTDANGRRSLIAPTKGNYVGRLLRPGYEPTLITFTVNSPGSAKFLARRSRPATPPPASAAAPSAGPAVSSGAGGAVADIATYPVLTEEVGYPPSPLAMPYGTPSAAPGAAPLGQIAAKAVADVLGWKPRPGSIDAKAFTGALNASFTCKEVEGHTECIWTPRTYAVQTDLAGGITGAQASIYSRAKEALDKALPLLDGLYALRVDADPQDVEALKAIVRTQMTELVNELGFLGGPRVSRVNQFFNLLVGTNLPSTTTVITEPDALQSCTLQTLRDEFGLWSVIPPQSQSLLINTVEEEQNVTNFRILVDYMTSLAQNWVNSLTFFGLNTQTPFFGTQLVLISRQLSVVAESVNEVRFALDSVFIGPSERQTLQIDFLQDPSMFLEDLLSWVQRFASEEGPSLIKDGGKFAVQNSFSPVATQLERLVAGATPPNPTNLNTLPQGYRTARVQRALQELDDQLTELVNLTGPIQHTIPSQT